MDRQKTLMLSKEIEAAIKAVVEKHKCTLNCSNPRFSATMMRFKVEVTDSDAPAPVISMPASTYPKGHRFQFSGKTYVVSGARPGRGTIWILCERQPDGKVFRFKPDQIPGVKPASKRSDAEILAELRNVECGLSPENLSCDGEASPSRMRAEFRQLTTRKQALIAELGRQPTHAEIYEIESV